MCELCIPCQEQNARCGVVIVTDGWLLQLSERSQCRHQLVVKHKAMPMVVHNVITDTGSLVHSPPVAAPDCTTIDQQKTSADAVVYVERARASIER
jgi:hypothetical protein